ncbi:protein of unknown function (plasmid) [Caballeronia sp. S22]
MGTQGSGIVSDVTAATDGDDPKSHSSGVLQGHMAEPTDAENDNGVAGLGTALLQCIERGDTGAQDRRGFFGAEFFGNGHFSPSNSARHARAMIIAQTFFYPSR